MRLFVAVDVPEALRNALDRDVVDRLRPALPSARWTRPAGRHLTLAFLGEVADPAPVTEALGAVDVAGTEAAFDAIGGFPNLRRPRVLWVGVGPGAEALGTLAADVQRALAPVGFEPERRGFRAHVTLARFKRPEPVGELPAVEVPSASFLVEGFTLYRSQLHPEGARYSVVERFGA